MKRQHTYESLLAQKLNKIASPAIAGLWDRMEAILDEEMPQQPEKKRRFGAWWFSTNMLLAASLLTATGGAYTWNRLREEKIISTNAQAPNHALPATGLSKTSVATQAVPEGEKQLSPLENASEKNSEPTKEQTFHLPAKATHQGKNNATSAGLREHNNAIDVVGMKETDLPANSKTLAEVEAIKANVPAIFNSQKVEPLSPADAERKLGLKKRPAVYVDKGVSFGLALNYPVAINGQRKNDLDINGKKAQWQDYIPSVYAQLHLNKKFYVQAEWAPIAAQYTPNYTLYRKTDQPNPDEKDEKVVKLNKLFYTNIPLSLHYNTGLKGLTVGAGIQYSQLKKVILQDQEYYHVIGPGYWTVNERKNEVAAKAPNKASDHNSGDVVDDVVKSFRRDDWRLLADVGYQHKALGGGLRYTRGLHYYINSNFTDLPVKGRNESLQLYFRYNLFDTRKK